MPTLADPEAMTKGYTVKRLADAPSVPCPCGLSTRLLTAADGSLANFHITFIKDSVKHYHKNCAEIYYVLDGVGRLELNDDEIDVEPGALIVIEPYTAHRLRSDEGVRTIVLGIPALHPDDEYFVVDDRE